MSKIIKRVNKKLNEYGIQVYNSYKLANENEYVFYIEDAILFVNIDENSIGISLQATTKPDRAASLALMINEIGYTIYIMEPFIFDEKKEFVSGKKAFELITQTQRDQIIEEIAKHQYYIRMLETHQCYEC